MFLIRPLSSIHNLQDTGIHSSESIGLLRRLHALTSSPLVIDFRVDEYAVVGFQIIEDYMFGEWLISGQNAEFVESLRFCNDQPNRILRRTDVVRPGGYSMSVSDHPQLDIIQNPSSKLLSTSFSNLVQRCLKETKTNQESIPRSIYGHYCLPRRQYKRTIQQLDIYPSVLVNIIMLYLGPIIIEAKDIPKMIVNLTNV